jgi:hypothetical protein
MRTSMLLIAGSVGLIALLPARASAQWWSRTPTDFEGCADAAEKAASKEEKTAALAECNAKFAGRRKPGGGYTYYDFMQDRTFDIAGPNPTPDEQKYIDQQYTVYLEGQRRNSIAAAAAAVAAKQREQEIQPPPPQPLPPQPTVQQVSLKSDVVVARVPMPVRRPTEQQQAAYDSRLRAAECAKHTFSCEWPKLSESLNGLKKIFSSTPAKDKRS